MLLALHVQDSRLGSSALKIMEPLIISEFLDCPGKPEVLSAFLRLLVRALCDSTYIFSASYQKRLLKLLLVIVKAHKNLLPTESILDILVATTQIMDTAHRIRFLKLFLSMSIEWHVGGLGRYTLGFSETSRIGTPNQVDDDSDSDGSGAMEVRQIQKLMENASGEKSESKSKVDPEKMARSIVVQLVRNIHVGKSADKILVDFMTENLTSSKFRFSASKLLFGLFESTLLRNTAGVVLVLCKMSLEAAQGKTQESNSFQAAIFDFGLSPDLAPSLARRSPAGHMRSACPFTSEALELINLFIRRLASSRYTFLREDVSMMFVLRRFLSIAITRNLLIQPTQASASRTFKNALA
eukprot:51694_1